MKKLSLVLFVLLAMAAVAPAQQKSHPVKTYVKKDGTVVEPHRQTNPNHTQRDNYSAKGNINPYTGKAGTKTPKR